ncbi:MAG: hypothetical protein NZL95_07280, partial [Chitinophagales bacterium]|nr:hypothetical protein [Chitinophagales bacterium]MDW8428338.1 DUF6569 family protein [Chitinophagales bacterium]
MNQNVKSLIESFRFGEVVSHENVSVIPLYTDQPARLKYLTLAEAIEQKLLVVSEISQSGSVPQLSVANQSALPVLILDGEELIGAKQNRIANTTMLIAAKSKVVIPVSCTEAGRWSYRSNQKDFKHSGHIMPQGMRSRKEESVMASLAHHHEFRAEQFKIWNDISEMSARFSVKSPTGAMNSIYESQKTTLMDFVKALPAADGQRGMISFLNGKIAGIEYLSLPDAYRLIHSRLIRSLAIDAIGAAKQDSAVPDFADLAMGFLNDLLQASESSYVPVGLGTDFRYAGKQLLGSALVHEDEVIHQKAFR